jgi:hypothetical protein
LGISHRAAAHFVTAGNRYDKAMTTVNHLMNRFSCIDSRVTFSNQSTQLEELHPHTSTMPGSPSTLEKEEARKAVTLALTDETTAKAL